MTSRFGKVAYLTAALAALVVGLGVLAVVSSRGMSIWQPSGAAGERSLRVARGDSLPTVLRTLEEAGNTPDSRFLSLYARITQSDRRLKQGRYAFPPDWSGAQIVEQLAIGANDPARATFPPGSTVRQIADRAEEAGWTASAEDLVRAATGETARVLGGRDTLEGLLAPDTFFYDEESPAEEILKTLHDHWKGSIRNLAGDSDLGARMRNGLTLYDTVILASLVEKEAAGTIEMATVSSVFHNRIRKNWPLGASATLRYAIDDWERGENELPVNLVSPFNTYRRPGLPPHPICSPSREALLAALHPPDTPYLFFVADGEGKSIFNITHEEHIRSARDYRKKMAERRSAP